MAQRQVLCSVEYIYYRGTEKFNFLSFEFLGFTLGIIGKYFLSVLCG